MSRNNEPGGAWDQEREIARRSPQPNPSTDSPLSAARTVTHGDGATHAEGAACPHCHQVTRTVERAEGGGLVILQATAVHAHACPYWRFGKRHAPCNCGAVEAWESNRERLAATVLAAHPEAGQVLDFTELRALPDGSLSQKRVNQLLDAVEELGEAKARIANERDRLLAAHPESRPDPKEQDVLAWWREKRYSVTDLQKAFAEGAESRPDPGEGLHGDYATGVDDLSPTVAFSRGYFSGLQIKIDHPIVRTAALAALSRFDLEPPQTDQVLEAIFAAAARFVVPVPTDRPEPIDEERERAIGRLLGITGSMIETHDRNPEALAPHPYYWPDLIEARAAVLAAYRTEPGETA